MANASTYIRILPRAQRTEAGLEKTLLLQKVCLLLILFASRYGSKTYSGQHHDDVYGLTAVSHTVHPIEIDSLQLHVNVTSYNWVLYMMFLLALPLFSSYLALSVCLGMSVCLSASCSSASQSAPLFAIARHHWGLGKPGMGRRWETTWIAGNADRRQYPDNIECA